MFLENLSNYIDYLCLERGLSNNTEEAYRRDLMEFIDYLDAHQINNFDEIKRSDINLYIRDLRKNNLAPTSVTRKIASLRGWFKWMSGMNLITHDPTVAIEQPKLSKHLPKVLSINEVETLLSQELPLVEKAMLEV
ncbi:MAG: site-specific integrase, partial [Candidatus Gastranaerophilales bacterium]|nr:site-specific integrase [Candidatus Gastranaerophilales bacterium]